MRSKAFPGASMYLGAFWLRRARRLLPALLVVLVVVALVVRLTYPTGLYPDLRMSELSALFYFSNWWQIAVSGNYFVATGAVYPLTHTWSLAVEEQFYLVGPLVVLAVSTWAGLRPGDRGPARRVGHRGRGLGRRDGLPLPPRDRHHPALLGHRHPRPVHPGRGHPRLRAHPGRAPPGHSGMAPVATSPRARAVLTTVGLAGFGATSPSPPPGAAPTPSPTGAASSSPPWPAAAVILAPSAW